MNYQAALAQQFDRIDVWTNHFPILQLPTAVFFQFDVIDPEYPQTGRNLEVIDQLWRDHAARFNPRPLYDGRKNMYSTRDISNDYPVYLGRRRDAPTHVVKIRRVGTINTSAIKMLTQKRNPHDPHDMYAKTLSLLQLLVRQAPSLRHGFRAHVKAFFVAHGSQPMGRALIARRGYFQSIRPTPGRLLVNVDTVCALVYQHQGRLIDVMADWLGLANVHDLRNLPRQQLAELRSFLKGVRVKVTVAPHFRARPIADIVPEAAFQEFDIGSDRITVEEHFKNKYNVTLTYRDAVGVRIGRTAIIPAELCQIVEGQLFRKKAPVGIQNAFLKFATQRPDHRLDQIRKAVGGNHGEQQFDYSTSDFMLEAGMSISTEPMSLPSQVIKPPPILFRGTQQRPFVPSGGAWNLMERQFHRPGKRLRVWSVINFDVVDVSQIEQFITVLVDNLMALGLNVDTPRPQIFPGQVGNPEKSIEEAWKFMRSQYRKDEKPQLLLAFLPQNAAECRRQLKFWGDMLADVSTQCVRNGKWNMCKNRNQLDQYCNNLALKINVRLEGVNCMIDSPLTNSRFYDSMVIGADVGHPGPGVATRPSMTGLVASVSPGAAMVTSFAGVQQPRLEMIEDLAQMVSAALNSWLGFRKKEMGIEKPPPPKNIFFYRDGVSEGEFEQVANEEIPMIKRAFEMVKIPPQHHPKLLFVIVGKRHHVRFFPKSPQQADKSGNCPPGLVVDDHITNPNYTDFYLQSHSGLLGSEQIQMMTYHLCHMYASATRSVSIPAPVYYADKICARLAFHCPRGDSLSDSASTVAGSTSGQGEFDLEEWKRLSGWVPQAKNNWRMNFL